MTKATASLQSIRHLPFRLAEVETLLERCDEGQAAEAWLGAEDHVQGTRRAPKWCAKDLKPAERDELVKRHGYNAFDFHE